ncbi:hypothetical protein Aperf_G00000097372 [Anoplocephala perfoliata]
MLSRPKRSRLSTTSSSEGSESSSTFEGFASHIVPKLSNANIADLVILSMANLPTSMPPDFKASYSALASSRSSNFSKIHLAGLLAELLVSWSGTGEQISSPNRTVLTNFFNTDTIKQDASITKTSIRPLPSHRRRAFMEDAFKRILAFNPRSDQIGPHIRSSDLDAKDAARSRILLRLALRSPRSSDLHKILFKHSLSKVEENFDLLMSLLTHEYLELRKAQISEGILKNNGFNSSTRGFGDAENSGVIGTHEELEFWKTGSARGEEQKSSITNLVPFQSVSHSYVNLFNKILHQISKPAVKKPYMCRFFLEAPVLTPRVISFLKDYCAVPEQAEYGFQVVRTLIEMKPTQWREELLNLLFGFSAFEEATVRDAAIKATSQLADSSTKWEEVVEDRAVERMRRILQPKPTSETFADLFVKPPTLTEKWTNETCKLCAQLFLGLLPRRLGKLLSTLADIYVTSKTNIQSFILQNMDAAICQINLLSPYFLSILKNCPPGAESLITRMLLVLTDPLKVAPTASNRPIMPPLSVVKYMRCLFHERGQDVRFIIPVIVGLSKQEVIESLPQIFQLGKAYIKVVVSRLIRGSELGVCIRLNSLWPFAISLIYFTVLERISLEPQERLSTLVQWNTTSGLTNVVLSGVATQSPPNLSNSELEPQSSSANRNLGPLTPVELLVAIHLLRFTENPKTDGGTAFNEPNENIQLIQQACEYCFKERTIFTQKRLKQVIDQLLDRPVVPKLFFSTVLRASTLYPRLSEYTLDVLIKMIKKRPRCYPALLKLPPKHLRSVFEQEPELRTQMRLHVEKFPPERRARIPRVFLEALKLGETPPSGSASRGYGDTG